jgi:hypothetical protein
LSGEVAAQRSGLGSAQEGTTSKERARAALKESLDAIFHTAHALALDQPGVDRKFRPPRSAGDRVLIDAAQAVLDEATALKADFVAHAMEPNFLAELKTRIADFEEATSDQQSGRDAHVSATVGIGEALESGLEAVKRLDAIARNRLKADAQTRALWARARRIGESTRAAHRPRAVAAPASSTAMPPPATSATAPRVADQTPVPPAAITVDT